MLERLVLKNGVECTSQRLKRMSGARVMTIFLSSGSSGGVGYPARPRPPPHRYPPP